MSPLGRRMIEDIRHVSDRIVFTGEGRIFEEGSPDDIL
jgi:ABC-type histidine transport system ATPase subunit